METLKEWLKPELIWFLIGLAMLLLELALPGLIIFFFGIGACVVAFMCLLMDISLNTQLTAFLVFSVVLLLTLRRWLKNVFVGRVDLKEGADELLHELVGKKATVTKEIRPDRAGRVEVHGTNWNAEADESIPEGTPVEIVGKHNITLKVQSCKRGAS
jgi:membrane protein implicated in regulation of membrane protease activity